MVEPKEETYTREDRDLLIELKTQMAIIVKSSERLEKAMNEIKDSTISRIEILERQKANTNEIEKIYNTRNPKWDEIDRRIDCKVDREECEAVKKRVMVLENWKSGIVGMFVLIGVVISLVVYIYIKDTSGLTESIEKNSLKIDQLIHK